MESVETQWVECSECGKVLLLERFHLHECMLENDDSQASTIFSSQPGSASEPEEMKEETLIGKLAEAVQARTPLWDHTLPLKQRSKEIKEKMWREVFQEINGLIPLEHLEKKGKNLKDTFLKHLRTYKPSGAGLEDKKKWKHFDNLFFLAEKNEPKRTITNTSESELMSPVSTGSHTPASTPSTSAKRKKDNETNEILLNILKEPPPSVPQTPQLSPVLLTIQSILEKLPTRVRMQAEIDILNKVYALYDSHVAD